jgi:hypothetical protein
VVATTTRTRLSRDSGIEDNLSPPSSPSAILTFALNGLPLRVVARRTRSSRAADVRVLVPAADLDPDRRPDEPEFLAQLVDEEPFVREMKRRGDVGEKHERRRSDADLRRVHDAHVLAAWAHGRVGRGHLLDEPVQRRRRHPHAPRRGHFVDGLEDSRRALARQRGDMEDGSEVEEPHAVPEPIVEALHERVIHGLHQVPFVHDDHDAAPGPVGLAADRGVLIGGAGAGVDDERDDVGIGDRLLGERDADHFDLAAAADASGPAHAGRVDDSKMPPVPDQRRINRVARGARHVADEHAFLAKEPIHERRLSDVGTADDGHAGFLIGDRRTEGRGLRATGIR